ncbi:MAG: M28 family metallopeptidase [Candidatus Helarchaeota archaeon]
MNSEKEIKNYMYFIIQDICDKIGPRSPCSIQEAKCAEYIQKELKKYTSFTCIEKFFCHPGSYRATFRIPMLNIIISTIFYWLYYLFFDFIYLIFASFMIIISVIIIQTNLLRNIEFIDPLFKKKESTNVFGKFKPKNTVNQIILIGGHHDSNWEFPIIKKNIVFLGIFMALPVIFNHLMLGIFILKIILYFFQSNFYFFLPEIDLIFLISLSIVSPFLIYSAINIISQTPVMGANDNLSAIAIILALAKYLKNITLNNTEVWLVSHGCEEIGNRGSKRFSKTHFDKLKNALVINLDMLGTRNTNLIFDISEEMFLIKLDKKLAAELSKIADELNIPNKIGHVEAFTDSMAYAQSKIKACSIISLQKKGLPVYYHTTDDTIEKLEFNNLWNCYQILIEFIKKVEKNIIKF